MKTLFMIAALTALPSAALAQAYSCEFVTECLDTDCAATEYESTLTLEPGPDARWSATYADPSETVTMTGWADAGAIMLVEAKPEISRILSISGSSARYVSVLGPEDMTISYYGRCEEVK